VDRTLADGRLAGGVLLAPMPDKDGYLVVSLPGGKVPVHVLVLGTFRGPCPEGLERLHRNGNNQDNRLRNLRYGTKEENERDKGNKRTRGRKETEGWKGIGSRPSLIVSPVSNKVAG
jgi:hypothetical protein